MSSKNEKFEEESLITTKEVLNLEELTDEAIEKLEDPIQKEMDLNMDEADLLFQEEIEKLEVPEDTIILESPSKQEKKKNEKKKKSSLKEKWQALSSKKKGCILFGILLVFVLIGIGIFFLCKKPQEKVENPIPDVIVEKENYRYENGVLHFLEEEEDLGTYDCTNKDETLCYVAFLTNNDEFDELKQVDEKNQPIERRSQIYARRYAFVFDNKSQTDEIIKLYDMKENKVIEEFLMVKSYDNHNDLAIVKNMKNKVGILSFKSKEVREKIPYEYEEIGFMADDTELEKIAVKKDGNYYLINEKNDILTTPFQDKIVGATKTHLKTKSTDGTYHVYTYQKEDLGSGNYAHLLDSYIIFVRDLKLYVTDYQKHPMNMEGISLRNDTYTPIATYKDGKLETTKRSFEADVYDKTLTLKIYDGDSYEKQSIHLQEGLLSAKLAFLNYFDGKLYIYRNEAKTDLLGTYPCTNHNPIEENTTSLTACTIAKEAFFAETRGNEKEKDASSSLGTIPIFHNRYAFIKDGEETIVLYDLKESTTKAKYKAVDTRSYTKTDTLTFGTTAPVYYIGQSERSGKFGLAKITANSVEVQIPFENKSIKKLGDYYVVEKDDGYYLTDLSGKLLTNVKKGPIVDYHGRYLKVLLENKYQVCGFKEDLTGESYDYIELYDQYYATVHDKKLSIYKYNEEEPKITNIELFLENYTGDKTKAFRLTFKENIVTIEIGLENQTYGNVQTIDLTKVVKPKPSEEPKPEDTPTVSEGEENATGE